MKKRTIVHKVRDALNDTPVIAIIGPRQSGKSTLAKSVMPKGASEITLDDDNIRSLAINDPIALITGLGRPLLIDEFQKAINLSSTIKRMVDNDRAAGSYVITGSADLNTVPSKASSGTKNESYDAKRDYDSLAGRIEYITLLPFTQAEIAELDNGFLENLFDNSFKYKESELSQVDLARMIVTGGYPEVLSRQPHRRKAWFKSYIDSILKRDITEVYNVTKPKEVARLLHALAINTSELLNKSSLGRVTGTTAKTTDKYIATLEYTYLIKLIPAWHSNETKRLLTSEKIQFIDTGLLCSLRNITEAKLLEDRTVLGSVLETFIASELMKLVSQSAIDYEMHHYRSRDGLEVDLILTSECGVSVGVEVKAGMTLSQKWFKPLQTLIDQGVLSHGVVVYSGTKLLKVTDKIHLIPVSELLGLS
jgi:predicted AAA+ superfamily ATPase